MVHFILLCFIWGSSFILIKVSSQGAYRPSNSRVALVFIPFSFWQQGLLQADFANSEVQWAVFNCILLGIVGSAFATFLFYVLVQKVNGLFASLVTYGIPFVALFRGFMDGEIISITTLVCLAIILTGVYLANRPVREIEKNK